MRRVGRHAFQRLDYHRFDARVVDGARGPRPRLVVEPVQALLDEAPAPLSDRSSINAKLFCDLLALQPSAHISTMRARMAIA
jgi:hypothetical protein